MKRYKHEMVECENGDFVLRDFVIDAIKNKIKLVEDSNQYRSQITQGALHSIYMLQDLLNEIRGEQQCQH